MCWKARTARVLTATGKALRIPSADLSRGYRSSGEGASPRDQLGLAAGQEAHQTQVDDQDVIVFLLNTEIIPLCRALRSCLTVFWKFLPYVLAHLRSHPTFARRWLIALSVQV